MADNIITPEGRVSYSNVFKPRRNDLSGEMEYDITLIFPKDADLTALKQAAFEALKDKFGPNKDAWPDNLRQPFRKCRDKWKKDRETGQDIVPQGMEDPDAVFITAKTIMKPGLVDAALQDIIEPRDFYGGCWARISVRPYAYDKKGNRGVSLGLRNIQKTRDDEAFGDGYAKPQDEFEAVAGASSSGAASIFDDDIPF